MLKNLTHIDIDKISEKVEENINAKMNKAEDVDFLPTKGYLIVEDAAEILGIKKDTLRTFLRNGKLPSAIKIKNKWYIPKEELQSYQERINNWYKNRPKVMKNIPSLKGYLTMIEVSAQINLSRSKTSVLLNNEAFPNAIKIKNKWFIPEEDILFYLENKKDGKQVPSPFTKENQLLKGHLTTKEISERIHLGPSRILVLIHNGSFPNAVKFNGRWFIPEEDLQLYSKQRNNLLMNKNKQSNIQSLKGYLTTNEVAKELNISNGGVTALIKNGKLRDAIKHKKIWMIPESSLTERKKQIENKRISITKPDMINELNHLINNVQNEEHLKETIRLYSDFTITRLNATNGRINNVRRVFNHLRKIFYDIIIKRFYTRIK
ncbi:Helix-turn-helix domain protein [Paraliobacillus sp. PM-2]|uniref:helix-turn-helix domain-containing protein n=1 Tax=Paraliobacillus sp. PM-2 TaxID=1462524 RepID=UPI00061C5DDB|nr:helix-turn-helix domain-containing protein [Paraliobacillus sp. PM-2]CQR47965.1 Helix-turn-helix domain protein [Paraliobacillus sp. PM-2]